MRVCACFLLVGIFVYTHSSAPNPALGNKRSVNLALETVLEFNERDKASDIKFLDNVQNFITKVKTVIGKNSNAETGFRRDFKAPAVNTFTSFLQEIVNILNTFDNTTLINFIENLDNEVRKYHYRGCKFYELTENNDIRKHIAAKLDLIRRTPASVMKTNINTLSETLKNLNDDKNIKEIFDYINSLYRQDSRGKFQKVLTELELHGRSNSQSNTRLGEIIKNGVRSIIFDHYTNLNTNVRRDVKQKMEAFWKQFNKNSPSNNIANARASNKNMNEVKSLRTVSKKHTKNAEVKQSEPKNVGTKRDDLKRDNKRKKHTRKDTIDGPAKVQDKRKSVPSPQQTGGTNQQRTTIEPQQQSNSLSSQSLEIYHQSKEDTRQNKATHSKKKYKKTLMKSRIKSEKIEAVNPTTRNPTHNTVPNIYIEESTGRLPKEVLDKLSIKARGHNTTKVVNKHAPGRNKKNDKGRKSWHGKMYQRKHDTKRMTKYRSKYDSQDESAQGSRQKASENNNLIIKPVTSKLRQYRESAGSNKSDRSSPGTSKTMKFLDVLNELKIPAKSGKTVKPPRVTVTKKRTAHSRTKRVKYDEVRRMKATPRTSADLAAQKQLTKKKWKSGKHFENSFDYPSSSSEDMVVNQMEIKNNKTTEYQSEQKLNNLEKDLYLIRKIKNLEKEIEEVKSRVNDKTEDKPSESKETKETRSLSETKTGFDVNNDPKIVKTETLRVVDNKTKPIYILTNKDVKNIASKYNDVKANSENGTRNNADAVKVRELQQSIEPNKEKRKISKSKPFFNKSFIDSEPRQDKLQITETSLSKNGSAVIPNPYVQNLLSKYKKLMEGFKNAKSKINVNVGVDKVKENISNFAVTGTVKTAKEVLIDSVKDKDSMKIVEGKKSVPVFRSEKTIISNDFMDRKDKSKVTRIADHQKDIIEKDKNPKNNKTKFNIDGVKSRPKTKQTSYFESVQDDLLDMTKIANNKKEIFDKTVSVNDFKSVGKDKKPESIFRSDVNLMINDFKDQTNVAKVTRTADKNTDINQKYINFKINESIFRPDINLITNDFKDKTDVAKVTGTADKNTDINKKYKNYKNNESIIKSDVNPTTNDFKDKTDIVMVTRTAAKNTDINQTSKIFRNNEIKGIIESRSNINADLNDEIRELQPSTEPSKVKRKLAKAKPRLLIESFTIPGVEPIQIPGAVNKTEYRIKNTYFEDVGSNYNKVFSEFKNNKAKKHLRTGASYESKIEYTYPPLRDGRAVDRGLVTFSEKEAERMFKDQMRTKSFTKKKYNKPFKESELDTKVNNIYQGVKLVNSHESDVNKTSNNVPDTTENTKVIEKADSKTALIENKGVDTKGKTVGNDYQTVTVTKEQSPIIKEDNKTEVTLNIDVVTPEAKHGGAEMKYRAIDDASTGAVADNTEIESANTATKAAESTSSAAMNAVTTPAILESLTMDVILASTRSQSWRTSNSGF